MGVGNICLKWHRDCFLLYILKPCKRVPCFSGEFLFLSSSAKQLHIFVGHTYYGSTLLFYTNYYWFLEPWFGTRTIWYQFRILLKKKKKKKRRITVKKSLLKCVHFHFISFLFFSHSIYCPLVRQRDGY